jgi:triosephosphate isomerase
MGIMKKKKYIIANFKANPLTVAEAKTITKGIISVAKKYSNVETVVCPSFVHMESVIATQRNPVVAIGAQDISQYELGSHTGETPVDMLSAMGVSYVIVGHSERRNMGETEQDVQHKLNNALKHKLTPIVCIGELERDKDARYLAFIHDQLIHSLGDIQKKDISKIITLCLRHRLRKDPLEAIDSGDKVSKVFKEIFEIET